MKLSSIKLADTGVLNVINPDTGEPAGATITLMSPEHPKARAQAMQAERARRAAAARVKRQAPEDPETQRERFLDRLAYMTIGWSGFEEDDGSPMVHSEERAREIYGNPAFAWVRDQVIEFIGDRENFIVRSATTSSPSRALTSA